MEQPVGCPKTKFGIPFGSIGSDQLWQRIRAAV